MSENEGIKEVNSSNVPPYVKVKETSLPIVKAEYGVVVCHANAWCSASAYDRIESKLRKLIDVLDWSLDPNETKFKKPSRGVARCSDDDEFDEKKGYDIAKLRAESSALTKVANSFISAIKATNAIELELRNALDKVFDKLAAISVELDQITE